MCSMFAWRKAIVTFAHYCAPTGVRSTNIFKANGRIGNRTRVRRTEEGQSARPLLTPNEASLRLQYIMTILDYRMYAS